MNAQRIKCLLIKEITQIRRDPRLFGLLLAAPLIQLMILGFAATTDVRDIDLAVRDNDRSVQSREYIRSLESSGYFKTRIVMINEQGDENLLVAGKVGLVLVIPPGFGRNLLGSRPAPVQVLVDGADSNFASHGLNYLNKASRQFSLPFVRIEQEKLERQRGIRLPSVTAESRAWYNPELESRFFMVAGLLGVLLLVTTMIVTSMSLVKEREEGTMEQVIVTPLRAGEIILGKLLPFVVIGLLEITLALPVMLLVFHLHLRGSLFLLYLFSGLFLLTTLGLGLFISTLVKTQQQAMLVATFFVMIPFILISGFIFPVDNMPTVIRTAAYFIPLKYYLTIIRGLFLKGVGWTELWYPALILLAWGTGILSLAVLMFRKRLD